MFGIISILWSHLQLIHLYERGIPGENPRVMLRSTENYSHTMIVKVGDATEYHLRHPEKIVTQISLELLRCHFATY